jgi:predicted HTH domain antitoxin
MPVTIRIPDEIGAALKFPTPEIEKELTRDLAYVLYARWGLSLGLAHRMAGLTKRDFIDGLAARGLPRHYTEQDLSEDTAYADGCK